MSIAHAVRRAMVRTTPTSSEVDPIADFAPDTDEVDEAPRSSGRRRIVAVVALLLAAVAATATVVGNHRAAGVEEARAEALESARTRVPVLLSYDSSTLEGDLERAAEQTTGDFADDYRRILDEVVTPTASQREISTTAEVAEGGVVSGDANEVVVLVLLTQTTTASDQRPTISGSRVEVTMRAVDGTWKIAGLQPV